MKTISPDEKRAHTGWLGLEGASVLVAGSGGIGTAVARGFMAIGGRVTVVDRDPKKLQSVSSAVEFNCDRDRVVEADLVAPGAPIDVVAEVVGTSGGIDVSVHCIGVNDRRPMLEIGPDDWRRILEVNVSTAFMTGTAAGRQMAKQHGGRILFFSSVAGLMAHRNHGPYAASKGALNQMMRVMAVEWASENIGVNAIAPGYVETPLTSSHLASANVRSELERLIPGGKLGTVDQLVGPALFLSSRKADFITGQVIYVDGGRSLT